MKYDNKQYYQAVSILLDKLKDDHNDSCNRPSHCEMQEFIEDIIKETQDRKLIADWRNK